MDSNDVIADVGNDDEPGEDEESYSCAVSSNHYSVDGQAIDAMSHLRHSHPSHYANVLREFPEFEDYKLGEHSSWFDTDAMGVDVEWGSWLVDAIEQTGVIMWDDGEPYCTAKECSS